MWLSGLCAPFQVLRGIRQGGAFSGMLYFLAIEHLIEKLRLALKRLCIPGCMSPVNLSVYADDLVAFSEKKIDLLATDIGVFSLISSAKVNWE